MLLAWLREKKRNKWNKWMSVVAKCVFHNEFSTSCVARKIQNEKKRKLKLLCRKMKGSSKKLQKELLAAAALFCSNVASVFFSCACFYLNCFYILPKLFNISSLCWLLLPLLRTEWSQPLSFFLGGSIAFSTTRNEQKKEAKLQIAFFVLQHLLNFKFLIDIRFKLM